MGRDEHQRHFVVNVVWLPSVVDIERNVESQKDKRGKRNEKGLDVVCLCLCRHPRFRGARALLLWDQWKQDNEGIPISVLRKTERPRKSQAADEWKRTRLNNINGVAPALFDITEHAAN